MDKCYKNALVAILCLTAGSVINAGPKAVKDTAKAYAAMYGASFLSGTIYATKRGREIQEVCVKMAEFYKVPELKKIATSYGKSNPIYQHNIMTFQRIARTIPRTLPPFIWLSVGCHAYKNKDLNFV